MTYYTSVYRIGLILLAVLFPLYLAMAEGWLPQEILRDPLGLIMVFFITSVVFLIASRIHYLYKKFKSLDRDDERLYSVALVLFSLSAHALNLSEIRVFEPYVGWMKVYVWMIHLGVLIFPYRRRLPDWGQYILYAAHGAGLVLCIYLTIFLGPLIVIAIPAAIFLGLSLHATVPVWIGLRMGLAYRQMTPLPYAKRAYGIGAIVPVVVLALFMQQWHRTQHQITQPNVLSQPDLPEWVGISQQIPDHFLTEQVLLNEGINQQGIWWEGNMNNILNFTGGREFRRHDPLGIIARACYGPLDIARSDLRHILEARYDARHMTHRRLWRGNDLVTSHVETSIDLYPRYRLAYQEMTICIRNDNTSRWRTLQEAVYSFHLPPGAVATSLSLWVEGVERKSVLTTRSKADRAYETIVGRESRDPALLHWQEGNRVTITVFPCTPREERQFKIGFTTPMQYRDGELRLQNVPFDGPATWLAQQKITLHVKGLPEDVDFHPPLYWDQVSDTHWTDEGRYQADWALWMDAPPLADAAFVWQDHVYRMQEAPHNMASWRPRRIYLDINGAWSAWAIHRVQQLLAEEEVYVFAPGPTRLTPDNQAELIAQLRQQTYTLPPLYQIKDPAHSLIISASTGNTPLLSDLDDTPYSRKLNQWLLKLDQPLRWVNVSEDLAPFVQTLYDLRVIHLHRCDRKELETLLDEGEFPVLPEAAGRMFIPSADVQIVQAEASADLQPTDAPDHVFRLFAYQRLLREIGQQFYDREALEEQWLRQAEEAYVVSPVSSLLVLETDADYERFDIEANNNTLGNAVAQGDGAAPEPEEWLLIVLFGLTLIVVWRMRR